MITIPRAVCLLCYFVVVVVVVFFFVHFIFFPLREFPTNDRLTFLLLD